MTDAAPAAATATTAPAAATTTTAAPATTAAAAGNGSTTAGTTTQTPASTAAAPAALKPGEAGFTLPQELRDWGTNKGYTPEFLSTADGYKLAHSTRELERMMHAQNGADKLIMPKDVTDFTQVKPVLERLGAPKEGAGYGLELPQGGDKAFLDTMTGEFAKVGLLPEQAREIFKAYNGVAEAMQANMKQQAADAARADVAKLEAEWATDTKHNSELASQGFNRVIKDIGLTPERAEEIRNGNNVTLSAYEFAKLMKSYADIAKVGGDTFETGDANGKPAGGGHTPESAKAEKNRLLADPVFAQKYMKGDAEAKAQITKLIEVEAKGFNNPTTRNL